MQVDRFVFGHHPLTLWFKQPYDKLKFPKITAPEVISTKKYVYSVKVFSLYRNVSKSILSYTVSLPWRITHTGGISESLKNI